MATCLGLIGALLIGIPAKEAVGWWRVCFWLSTVPAALLALCMEFCAESPHWLYKAVTCLCWQRSKPVIVNEKNYTAETALLGDTGEDSVLMPSPLPSVARLSFSFAATLTNSRTSLTATNRGSTSTVSYFSTTEETPVKSQLWPGGFLSRLQAPRTSYNLEDNMDVFSPLGDVQPMTPSLGNWWDDNDEKKKILANEKKSTFFSSPIRKFPYSEGDADHHPNADFISDLTSRQASIRRSHSRSSRLPL